MLGMIKTRSTLVLNEVLERYLLVDREMLDVLILVHLHHVLVHPLLVSKGHSTDVANYRVIIDLDLPPVCGLCELVHLPDCLTRVGLSELGHLRLECLVILYVGKFGRFPRPSVNTSALVFLIDVLLQTDLEWIRPSTQMTVMAPFMVILFYGGWKYLVNVDPLWI